MKVNLKLQGKYNCYKVKTFFNRHKKTIEKVLPIMASKYKIRLPHTIVLRPFKQRTDKYHGRLYFKWDGYYEMILNYELSIIFKDKGHDTIIHEIAHLIEYELYGSMRHGEKFRRIFNDCKVVADQL